MNSKTINVSVICLLISIASGFTQSVSTPVVGFQKISMPSGGSAFGPTFVKASVFNGTVSISGNTVNLTSGSLSGNLGPTSFSDRANYPRYYAEVTSTNSPYYGYNFDVGGNTTSSFSSANIPSGLTGSVSISIRPHFTLQDVGAGSLNDGDSVNFVNDPTGQQATFYAIGGDWYDSGFNPGFGHKPIYPGEAVVFTGQSGQVTVTLVGQVKTTPTAVPLSISSYANMVVAINPSASVAWANQGLQSTLNDGAAFTLYTTDGSFAEGATYYTIGGGVYDASFTQTSSPISVTGGTGINIGSLDSDKVILLPGVPVN